MTNKIRIGVDFYFASQLQRRGIGNYTYHLYRKLSEIDQIQPVLFIPKSASINENDFQGSEIIRLPSNNYLINENFFVPLFAYFKNIDFLHFTGNSVPPLSVILNKNVCSTIHDTMFMDLRLTSLAGFSQLLPRIYRMTSLKLFGSRLKRVFTVSEYSARNIIKYFPEIRPSNICITYQGVGEEFYCEPLSKTITRESTPAQLINVDSYFFAIGAREPRKNLSGVLSSYSKFLTDSRHSQGHINLVIAGLDNKTHADCLAQCQKLNISPYVISMDFVTQTDLLFLYRNALALIFISTEEGFGIPLLEAFALRCPVICSNTTSLPEIASDAAILVDPLSPSAVAEAMISILDTTTRNELIEKGSCRLSEFTWMSVANRLLDSLRHES